MMVCFRTLSVISMCGNAWLTYVLATGTQNFPSVYVGMRVLLAAHSCISHVAQEMTSMAQRLGPEIIAVLDSFLQSSNMVVG